MKRPRRAIFRRTAAQPQPDSTHVVAPELQQQPEPEPEPQASAVLVEEPEPVKEEETHGVEVPEPAAPEAPQAVFVSPVAEEQPATPQPVETVSTPWDTAADASPESDGALTGIETAHAPDPEPEPEKQSRPRGRPRSADVLQRDQAVFNALADGVEMTKAEIAGVLGLEQIPVYQSLWRMQVQGHVRRTRHGRSHRWQQTSQQGPTA